MLLEEIKNKLFIGTSKNLDQYLTKEKNDYLFLTIDNVSEDSFFYRKDDKYISYKKLQKEHLTNQTLEYGDFIIFRKNNDYHILQYANEIGDKILPSGDFIILQTIGGGYFKNFLYDIDGKLYFKEKLNSLFIENDYE